MNLMALIEAVKAFSHPKGHNHLQQDVQDVYAATLQLMGGGAGMQYKCVDLKHSNHHSGQVSH
jgi:hypothetical protein